MTNSQCYLLCSTIFVATSLHLSGWVGALAGLSIVWAVLSIVAGAER